MKAKPTPPTMLLVEPQFVMRRTMVTVARELGLVEFVEATSVAKARPLLAAKPFRGLVLDLGDDPAEALALLDQLRAGDFVSRADMPVIALSYASSQKLADSLEVFQPLRMLPKPFKVGELLESVARMGVR